MRTSIALLAISVVILGSTAFGVDKKISLDQLCKIGDAHLDGTRERDALLALDYYSEACDKGSKLGCSKMDSFDYDALWTELSPSEERSVTELYQKVKTAVANKDGEALNQLIAKDCREKKPKGYFKKHSFDSVFDKKWVKTVMTEKPEKLGAKGRIVGDGHIWINRNAETKKYEITAINFTKL